MCKKSHRDCKLRDSRYVGGGNPIHASGNHTAVAFMIFLLLYKKQGFQLLDPAVSVTKLNFYLTVVQAEQT